MNSDNLVLMMLIVICVEWILYSVCCILLFKKLKLSGGSIPIKREYVLLKYMNVSASWFVGYLILGLILVLCSAKLLFIIWFEFVFFIFAFLIYRLIYLKHKKFALALLVLAFINPKIFFLIGLIVFLKNCKGDLNEN